MSEKENHANIPPAVYVLLAVLLWSTGGLFIKMTTLDAFAVNAGRSLLAVGLVALFAVFVERYSRVEEAHLERRFGEAWRAYRRRTPAVPGLRRTAEG